MKLPANKLTADEVEKRIQLKHPFVSLDKTTYINTTIKCRFIDEKYGEWFAQPRNILRGRLHPNRNFKYTAEEIQEKVNSISPFISIDINTYINSYKKARFIDSEYGEWWTIPRDVYNGHLHPKRRMTDYEEIQNQLQSIKPFLSIDKETYVGVSKKCKIMDSKFGEFWTTPSGLMKGDKRHPNSQPTALLSSHEIERRIQLTRPYISIKHETYTNTGTKCTFIDTEIGEWNQTPNNVLVKNTGHPNRQAIGLEVFVENLIHIPRFNKKPTGLLGSYIADFKLNDNLYLESDGIYWHSELVIEDKYYHFKKRECYEQSGLRVLQFRSDEILNKSEIVKSICYHHLRKTKVIYARKTTISYNNEWKKFFNNNHLMGYAIGKSVGLFINNECVAAISFMIKKDETHIVRFCTKIGYSVIGAYSKLLKEITKTFQGKIVNFVDLRYGTGKGLLQFGFKLEKITLGWNWTDGNNTFNRLKCRANMDARKLTQAEHAKEMKLFKIYDAGQAKYVKVLK